MSWNETQKSVLRDIYFVSLLLPITYRADIAVTVYFYRTLSTLQLIIFV